MMLRLNFNRRNILNRLLPTIKGKARMGSKIIKPDENIYDDILSKRIHRRRMLQSVGIATAAVTAGTLVVGCDEDCNGKNIDPAILNFALNLEYLEAEYYLRAAFGTGLSAEDRGMGAGVVVGGSQVPFANDLIRQYAEEIAADELAHVKFLRSALQDMAVPAPDINFTDAFNAAGMAIGVGPFNPFASDANFLLGAFVFEDVGVTAYNGAATLISSKQILQAAASILAVEAYHAGEIRVVLFALGQDNPDLIDIANAISDARDALDNDGIDNDQPITEGGATDGEANIVVTDANGLAFTRTTEAVLNIVYLNADGIPGGFFPNGLNGDIA